MPDKIVYQEVKGDGNIVAGEGIEIHDFIPDPNNPNLMTCVCGWEGLSKGADECPRCGHNHKADRDYELSIKLKEQRDFRSWLLIACIIILGSAFHLHTQSGIEFSNAFLICITSAVVVYVGYEYLKAIILVKLAKRKIK